MEGSSCEQGRSTHSEREWTWECRICLHDLQDPVCTLCGHLFCWPCLYQWVRDHPKPCPVCKVLLFGENFNVIPIYTGTAIVTPGASRPVEVIGVRIPPRPQPMLPHERRERMYQSTISRMVRELTELRRENESLRRQLAVLRRLTLSTRGDNILRSRISNISVGR